MLTDMCCSTTRFTADADSANNDNCLAELSFLIFNGVVSSALLLLFNQSWLNTSFALNLFCIFDEESLDEILGLIGHPSPFSLVKLEPTLLNVCEEIHLALVTLATLRPTTLLATKAGERWVSRQQDVHHHTKTP